jgi:hypothetical protein
MSALGQKQTSAHVRVMSALPPKAWIGTVMMSALCQQRSAARRAPGDDVDDFKRHHYFARLIDYLEK